MLTTFLVFEKCEEKIRKMPVNNNYQKVAPSAAVRLSRFPLVRSACASLCVLYRDAKGSSGGLSSLCEALERGASAACSRASPVLLQLEPQIAIANDFACKGLDWLETSFPVLLSPPDEVVAAAKNKVNEIRDVVCVATGGTVDTMQHTVTWAISRLHQSSDGVNLSLVEQAIGAASVGLDSALTLSEALVDQVLPPPEGDKEEEEAHLVERFKAAVHSGSYPGRVMKLTAKVCSRSYHTAGSKIHSVQIMASLSRSTTLVQDLQSSCQTLVWSLQELPQYFQHQVVSAFFFIGQMYNLSCPLYRQEQKRRESKRAAEASTLPKEKPRSLNTPAFRMRPIRTSVFENGCIVRGCVNR